MDVLYLMWDETLKSQEETESRPRSRSEGMDVGRKTCGVGATQGLAAAGGTTTFWDRGVKRGEDVPRPGSRGHLSAPGTTAGRLVVGQAGTLKEIQSLPGTPPKAAEGRWGATPGLSLPLPFPSLTRASH